MFSVHVLTKGTAYSTANFIKPTFMVVEIFLVRLYFAPPRLLRPGETAPSAPTPSYAIDRRWSNSQHDGCRNYAMITHTHNFAAQLNVERIIRHVAHNLHNLSSSAQFAFSPTLRPFLYCHFAQN